jgi:arylsulfatase
MGLVGYRTPNIDRIAKEGMIFTDYYGEQSCTAGRSSFITGQSVFPTGLSKVGLPGAELGLRKEDPTIAAILRPMGYATGQFGKNHLGDRDEHLPTANGFDEFFGNLYHLNAEEEPENEDYPKNPEFRKKFGPRGVIHSWANGDGTQKIEDTGPLTRKRMETVDDETSDAAIKFIEKAHADGKPFFVWWNGTRMHFRTHVKADLRGISGQDEYADGMVEDDRHIGKLLKKMDDLGITDTTVVFYSTDNGPHYNTWPDAGATPFRGEKNTNWEGGWRVPAMVRWPGKIKAGTVSNEIMHDMDWLPTFAAAAGDAGLKDNLLKGFKAGSLTYKVHLDG